MARRYSPYHRRLVVLGVLLFSVGGLLFYRLFLLQVVHGTFYRTQAKMQRTMFATIAPRRGSIFVHDSNERSGLYPIATNRDAVILYAVPKEIEHPQRTARLLAPLLSLEEQVLLDRLAKPDDPYELLFRDLNEEQIERITILSIDGLYFDTEPKRVYPEGQIASHIVGYVGFLENEKKGFYGLEGYFDEMLRGVFGKESSERDVSGRPIVFGEDHGVPAVDGSDLVLTIDRSVEQVVCEKVRVAREQYDADSALAIVVEVKTGAVRALCSAPDFDPNAYQETEDIALFNNPAIFYQYEPGSIFKPITMAAALDLSLVKPDDTYIDEGAVRIGKFTIRNSDGKAHGEQTMIQVLESSLNTGAVYVAEKVGKELFRKYVLDFGFGKPTNIELNKEVSGDLSILFKRGDIYLATASYGQGIAVTPMQMVMAYAAIANGGALMQPYIVDTIIAADGARTQTAPKEIRRVIGDRAVTLLQGMLTEVVEGGHATHAKVPGYYVAGKTGTAQIPKKDGSGYEENATIATFVGFFPVSNPRFALLTKIDRPRTTPWAASSAAPLFGDIAKFLVQYYTIPPDDIDS